MSDPIQHDPVADYEQRLQAPPPDMRRRDGSPVPLAELFNMRTATPSDPTTAPPGIVDRVGLSGAQANILGTFIAETPDPTSEIAKQAAVDYMADILQEDRAHIYNNYEQYIRQYAGQDIAPVTAAHALEQWWQSAWLAHNAKGVKGELFEQLERGASWEDVAGTIARIQAIEDKMPSRDVLSQNPMLNAFMRPAIQNLPNMLDPMLKGGTANMVTQLGAHAAMAFATKGSSLMVPLINTALLGTAAQLTSTTLHTKDAYRNEMIWELYNITDDDGNRVDPKLATAIAAVVGSLNGAVQTVNIMRLIPGGNQIAEGAVQRVMEKLYINRVLRNTVVRGVMQWGGVATDQAIGELLQEVTQVVGRELAVDISNQTRGLDFDKAEFEDQASRVLMAFSQGWAASAVYALPTTGVSMVQTATANARARAARTQTDTQQAQLEAGTERTVLDDTVTRAPTEIEQEFAQVMADFDTDPDTAASRLWELSVEMERAEAAQTRSEQTVDTDTTTQTARQPWQMTAAEFEATLRTQQEQQTRAVVDQDLRGRVRQGLPTLSDAQVDGVTMILEMRAEAVGMDTQTYINQTFQDQMFAPLTPDARDPLAQQRKGGVQFDPSDGRALVLWTENTDFTTAVHEIGHIFERQLSTENRSVLAQYFTEDGVTWTVAAQERFAEAWEAYVTRGEAPSPQIQTIFEQFAEWMRKVYDWVAGQESPIPEAVSRVFDQFLTSDRHAQVGMRGQMSRVFDQFMETQQAETGAATPLDHLTGRNAPDTTTYAAGVPVTDIAVDRIGLSSEVAQFKADADPTTGVVEPLAAAQYERLGTAPIVVWERLNGDMEVITGRHRLELAKRLGETTIPAQVVREAAGFDAAQARSFDAESNIRDGQGTISDYLTYFEQAGLTAEQASERGLISREKGRTAFSIATYGTQELTTLYRNGKISAQKAAAIAEAAPGMADIQRAAMAQARAMTAQELGNFATLLRQRVVQQDANQVDLFGSDDTAVQEAASMAREAARISNALSSELTTLGQAMRMATDSRRQQIIEQYGFTTGDVAAINARMESLRGEVAGWQEWYTDARRFRQVRENLGLAVDAVPTDLSMETETVTEFVESDDQSMLFQTKSDRELVLDEIAELEQTLNDGQPLSGLNRMRAKSGRDIDVELEADFRASEGRRLAILQALGDKGLSLRSVYRPDQYAIVHRSTRPEFEWQISYFDERGAWGDTKYESTEALIRDVRMELSSSYTPERTAGRRLYVEPQLRQTITEVTARVAEAQAGYQSEAAVTSQSVIPQAGQPFVFTYVRNTEQAPQLGERFGQDVEPAGRYVQVGAAENVAGMPGMESGTVRLNNPLVVDFGEGYESAQNWKRVLSQQYDGRTGEALSNAIMADGYDGIVTVERGGRRGDQTAEIVVLRESPQTAPMPREALTFERDAIEGATADLFQTEVPSRDTRLVEDAVAYFGTTKDPMESGYLLPDGRMLDMSGRHEAVGYERGRPTGDDYLAGSRTVDHRDLGRLSEDMNDFMARTGAVRFDYLSGLIQSSGKPDSATVTRLARIFAGRDAQVEITTLDGSEPLSYVEIDGVTRAKLERAMLRFDTTGQRADWHHGGADMGATDDGPSVFYQTEQHGPTKRLMHLTTSPGFTRFITDSPAAQYTTNLDAIGAWFTDSGELIDALRSQREYESLIDEVELNLGLGEYDVTINNPYVVESRKALDVAFDESSATVASEFKQELLDQGYDGIHVLDDYGRGESWVAFSPDQIVMSSILYQTAAEAANERNLTMLDVTPGMITQAVTNGLDTAIDTDAEITLLGRRLDTDRVTMLDPYVAPDYRGHAAEQRQIDADPMAYAGLTERIDRQSGFADTDQVMTGYRQARAEGRQSLQDFAAAIVPAGTDAQTRGILEANGVAVVEYTDPASRWQAVMQTAEAMDNILFATEGENRYLNTVHMQQVQDAVIRGEWVPDNVLAEYRTQEWAQVEIERRARIRTEAREARDMGQPVEDFVEMQAAFDMDDHGPDYFRQIYESAGEAPLQSVTDMANEWAGGMTREAMSAYLHDIKRNRVANDLPHKVVASIAKGLGEGQMLTEAQYKKIMDQVRWDTPLWFETVSRLTDANEDLRLIEQAAKAHPEETKLRTLQHQVRELREQGRVQIRDIESLQHQLELDRKYERDLTGRIDSLQNQLSDEQVAATDAIRSARREAQMQSRDARAAQHEALVAERARIRTQIRETRQAREYLKRLIKDTLRKPATTIAADYARQIEDIQAGLDPRSFTRGKAGQLRTMLMERMPGITDTALKSLLETELGRQSLRDMPLAELEAIHDRIVALRNEGREIRRAQLAAEYVELNEIREAVKLSIRQGEDPEAIVGKGSREARAETRTGAFHAIAFESLRPQRIAKMLDGGVEGAVYNLVVKEVNLATDAELRAVDTRIEAGTAQMAELGITERSLAREIVYQDGEHTQTYTADDVISMFIALQNEDSAAALEYGNKISRAVSRNLIDQLTDAERAWGNWMIDSFGPTQAQRINDVLVQDKNIRMDSVERYFPMVRQNVAHDTHDATVLEDVMSRSGSSRAYANRGFTKSRIKISPEHQSSIRLGATRIWSEQIGRQEHYINSGLLIKKLHRVFGDRGVQEAMLERYGQQGNKWVQKFTNDFANPNIYKVHDGTTQVLQGLRQHAALSYLAFNVVTMAKQAPSMAFFLSKAGPGDLLAATGQYLSNPQKMNDFVDTRDPQMKHRAIDRAFEELKLMDRNAYERIVQKVGKVGMAGIRFIDKQVTNIGWLSVYNRALRQGLAETEAIRLAQEAVLTTQPAAAAKDIAQMYRQHEALNWFLMFTNQLNQIWNMAVYDLPNAVKQGNAGEALSYAAAMGIGALAIGFINRGFRLPDEDKVGEELAKDFMAQLVSTIPLIGGSVKAGMDGWFGTGVDPFPVAAEAGRAFRTFTSESATDEQQVRAMLRLLEQGMVVTGLPTVQPKRVYRAITEGQIGELFGIREE